MPCAVANKIKNWDLHIFFYLYLNEKKEIIYFINGMGYLPRCSPTICDDIKQKSCIKTQSSTKCHCLSSWCNMNSSKKLIDHLNSTGRSAYIEVKNQCTISRTNSSRKQQGEMIGEVFACPNKISTMKSSDSVRSEKIILRLKVPASSTTSFYYIKLLT